jgi:hypothetical protein
MISAVQNQNGGISTVDALWTLIQSQTKTVREALAKRFIEEDVLTETQQQMVRRSLTKAFEELYSGEVKKMPVHYLLSSYGSIN